jgi:3-methyl-2-oxobutanoate hydroxymethyltransferase
MSKHQTHKRRSICDIRAAKGATPLVVLTAYTAPMAEMLDEVCDILMVGDSLGMVIYGYDSTLKVSLDQMIAHGDAVVRHSKNAMVVVDMPFGSYQASPEQAFLSAARILKETGAAAVKLEGGKEMAPTIKYLTERAIPVMAHVGLMPQHVNMLGGFRAQGKEKAQQKLIMEDALAVEEAGAFSVVLEGIMEPLGKAITEKLSIPTIGIGASPACDGQVLVVDDMLGMFEKTPRFVKTFAELRIDIKNAAIAYAGAVRSRKFPTLAQCYGTDKK